jgi:K+-sensing histidine kinase KdpD
VTVSARAQRVPLAAEIALAFLAGAGTFAVVGVVVSGIESHVVVGLVGVPYAAAVAAVARGWGVVYAVPIAMAGILAYDWFYLAPTHPLEFPDAANLVDLLVYLALAVLVGELAAHAARRGEVSEVARSVLATEQAALRRVATLVAEAVPARELLAAVAARGIFQVFIAAKVCSTRARTLRRSACGVPSRPAGLSGLPYGGAA